MAGTRFWFMNHVVNPALRALLRSPLRGLLDGSLLLLTYQGKKSGRLYTLPAQYARLGSTVYIVPGQAERKTWWRNLRGGAPVTLRLGGRDVRGQATALTAQDGDALVDAALAYFGRFTQAAQMAGVSRLADGRFDREAVRAAAEKLVVVRVTIEPRG